MDEKIDAVMEDFSKKKKETASKIFEAVQGMSVLDAVDLLRYCEKALPAIVEVRL